MLHTRRRIRRLYRQAEALLIANKPDEAWPYISEMTNLDMDDPGALYLLGDFMRKKGHVGIAAQVLRRAVSIKPEPVSFWIHFGACLHDLHQYAAAEQIWQMIRQKQPQNTAAVKNLAATYLQQGKFHDALNLANQAIELGDAPQGLIAVKGMAALGLGRWQEGFENYCGFYGDGLIIRKYRQPPAEEEPVWDGTPGLSVVVQGDQGIGDEIRFSSVLPDMAKDCTVIFDAHPKLASIMRRSFPQITVHGTRKSKTADWVGTAKIDASHHISGLGRFYRKRDSDFPRVPYLTADEDLRKKWRTRLADLPRPLVGLAWTGGNAVTNRENRSFDLATFTPIIQETGSFIDLSYHDSQPEVDYFNALSEKIVIRFDIDQTDYEDTLALIAELDLVVCVPTTVMHAAGAIGVPCFVFTPNFPHWEFGTRDDMIWYAPDLVRIFRGEIEDVRDAYLHRFGQSPAVSVYGAAKLDHPQGEQAGPDHASDRASTPNPKKGPDRVHF